MRRRASWRTRLFLRVDMGCALQKYMGRDSSTSAAVTPNSFVCGTWGYLTAFVVLGKGGSIASWGSWRYGVEKCVTDGVIHSTQFRGVSHPNTLQRIRRLSHRLFLVGVVFLPFHRPPCSPAFLLSGKRSTVLARRPACSGQAVSAHCAFANDPQLAAGPHYHGGGQATGSPAKVDDQVDRVSYRAGDF